MDKRLKFGLYLIIFGLFALFVLLFRHPKQPTYTASEVLGAKSNLTLFIEPDDGRAPLLELINNSQQIWGTIYLLSDPQIIEALASKSAQLILEEHPFGGNILNRKTKTVLGDLVSWGNPAFDYTHEKALVFDDQLVCILNMNLTKTGFTTNREYNICSSDPQNILEVKNIFWADKNRTRYQANASDLIVSPDNSRAKLTAFLENSAKQIDIAMEVISDEKIEALLCQKESNEVEVRLLIPDFKKVDNGTASAKLANCGAEVKTLKKPYLHAKLIVVDGLRAYVGSVNLTAGSLDKNRELGILVSQPDILGRLNEIFNRDWLAGS